MELLRSLQVSAAGMAAERARLEIVSSNIANANSTRSADGSGPYQRRLPVVKACNFQDVFEDASAHWDEEGPSVPQVVDVITDSEPGTRLYDPSHPDADPEGYVEMPNVNIVKEIVDLMTASRAYEANLNALSASKDMAAKSLDIGRK